MRITNNSSVAIKAPKAQIKFDDGSIDDMFPFGGSDGQFIAVGDRAIIQPLNSAKVKYCYLSRHLGDKTPVSAILTMGASQLTIPIKPEAPTLVSGT
jgi:hypothetical protein